MEASLYLLKAFPDVFWGRLAVIFLDRRLYYGLTVGYLSGAKCLRMPSKVALRSGLKHGWGNAIRNECRQEARLLPAPVLTNVSFAI